MKIASQWQGQDIQLAASLHYFPIAKTLIMRAPQKTDCFLSRSLNEPNSKYFEDFSKSS